MDKTTKFKEAIKIGLATVIAYYIGMRFGWMNPTWAAISVGMISLPTAGQSLNKGLERMGGTLLAFVAGLFFLGIYPQSRWLFFLAFTPYLAVVTYKMTGKNGQYFWFVAGFVAMMITTAGHGSSEYAFQFALFRALETLMGIVVWTLVSVFIWPRSNLAALKATSQNLLASKSKLVGQLKDSLITSDVDETGSTSELLAAISKTVALLSQTIMGAASENYNVGHLRHVWGRFEQSSNSTYVLLDKLSSTTKDLESVKLLLVIPNLNTYLDLIENRFTKASQLLSGESTDIPADLTDTTIKLSVDKKQAKLADYYQNIVLASLLEEVSQLNIMSLTILKCASEINGNQAVDTGPDKRENMAPNRGLLMSLTPLDPDRIRSAVMVVTSMWVGAFIWIYVNPPGHVSWYQFLPNVTLVLVQSPQVKFSMFKPFTYAYLVGLAVYVLLMPQLSMFWQLGLVLMAFTSIAVYYFTASAMRMALYLSLYNMLGIQNEQTYNFAQQANTMIFTLMALLVVVALSYITLTPRPEKKFIQMSHRFFRSCTFILSQPIGSKNNLSLIDQLRLPFYLQEIRALPDKMALWGAQIDHVKFPQNSAEQTQAIVSEIQMIAFRVEEIYANKELVQSSLLMAKLKDDFISWYTVIKSSFAQWSDANSAIQNGSLKQQLTRNIDLLRKDVQEFLNPDNKKNISKGEAENFYRLVGSLGSLSRAAIGFSKIAAKTNWAEWQEEKF